MSTNSHTVIVIIVQENFAGLLGVIIRCRLVIFWFLHHVVDVYSDVTPKHTPTTQCRN